MKLTPMLIALLLSSPALAGPHIWQEPVSGMNFIALPKGCFQMGSKAPFIPIKSLAFRHLAVKGKSLTDEQPKHEVCVDAFLLGETEVQAEEWLKVMGVPPPQGQGRMPASGISWDEAQAFSAKLNQISGGKYRFRLPTEAEWEYACRADDKKDHVPDREDHVALAWYAIDENVPRQPSAVGQLKANAWGLQDMLGNVWEWVADGYQADAYARHPLFNPLVTETPQNNRVLRGASHRSEPYQVRCANRSFYAAGESLHQFGLRLAAQPLPRR